MMRYIFASIVVFLCLPILYALSVLWDYKNIVNMKEFISYGKHAWWEITL